MSGNRLKESVTTDCLWDRKLMARAEFIDNLRMVSRELVRPVVLSGAGAAADEHLSWSLHSADLWLTPGSVEGFEKDDFPPQYNKELAREVSAFLKVAKQVPPDGSATIVQSKQARRHLQRVIELVGGPILADWLQKLRMLADEAKAAAEAEHWHCDEDKKLIAESLLGKYDAPRLRIRSLEREVVLDPVTRFGSSRRGIVDLVLLPTFEPAYFIVLRDDSWYITKAGSAHERPFSREALVRTIRALARP